MKRLLFLYLLCSVGLLYPQKKQPKAFSFNVEGEIRRFQGRTIYLHHKWDDKELTDSAQVTDGRFNFRLRSAEPNMYWFTLAPGIAAQPNLIFFVDKGKVTARLIGDSLSASSVKAGKTQDDYVAYLAIGRQLAARQQSLQAEYTLAMQKSDRDRVKQVQAEYQASSDDYFAVDLKNFVKAHPKSAVSGYIIYREFNNPNVPLALAEECLGYLDKSIENTKFVRLASKRVADLKGTQIGATATNFSQPTPDGQPVQLTDLRGRYVLVDFWASWCRPCRMENPNVVAAYTKYKDKGFTVLGVSLDSSKEQWMAAIKNDGLVWTQVSDLKGGNNEAAVLYGIQTIPQNVLIDRDGKIIAKNLRGPELESRLAELLK